jgi:hypothetical protein
MEDKLNKGIAFIVSPDNHKIKVYSTDKQLIEVFKINLDADCKNKCDMHYVDLSNIDKTEYGISITCLGVYSGLYEVFIWACKIMIKEGWDLVAKSNGLDWDGFRENVLSFVKIE